MVWSQEAKIKRLQHEASEHNKKVAREVLHSDDYTEYHQRKLKYKSTPEEDYLTGFGEMI